MHEVKNSGKITFLVSEITGKKIIVTILEQFLLWKLEEFPLTLPSFLK